MQQHPAGVHLRTDPPTRSHRAPLHLPQCQTADLGQGNGSASVNLAPRFTHREDPGSPPPRADPKTPRALARGSRAKKKNPNHPTKGTGPCVTGAVGRRFPARAPPGPTDPTGVRHKLGKNRSPQPRGAFRTQPGAPFRTQPGAPFRTQPGAP